MHTSATATSATGGTSSPMPTVIIVSTATIAPELLHIGEDIESSIYLSPRYPTAIDTMYSADTGRYVRITSRLISTPPKNISYAA